MILLTAVVDLRRQPEKLEPPFLSSRLSTLEPRSPFRRATGNSARGLREMLALQEACREPVSEERPRGMSLLRLRIHERRNDCLKMGDCYRLHSKSITAQRRRPTHKLQADVPFYLVFKKREPRELNGLYAIVDPSLALLSFLLLLFQYLRFLHDVS